MKLARTLLALGFFLPAISATAQTPPTSYKLHEMNFDMWCQETKHYPPERCDKRLPEDDQAFQAYRRSIEKYELPYLERQRQEQNWDRSIMHNDPVDNPRRDSTAPPGSTGTSPQSRP